MLYVYRVSCKLHSDCWQNGTLNCAIRTRALTHSLARMSSTFLSSLISIVIFLSIHIRIKIDAYSCVCGKTRTTEVVMYGWSVNLFCTRPHCEHWTCMPVINARCNAHISCGVYTMNGLGMNFSFYLCAKNTSYTSQTKKTILNIFRAGCVTDLNAFQFSMIWKA